MGDTLCTCKDKENSDKELNFKHTKDQQDTNLTIENMTNSIESFKCTSRAVNQLHHGNEKEDLEVTHSLDGLITEEMMQMESLLGEFTIQPDHMNEMALAEKTHAVLQYPDGGIYDGQVTQSNSKHGNGILYTTQGKFYGLFKYDTKHYGRMIYTDGSFYEGFFIEDKPEGTGSFGTLEGVRYYGEFKSGLQHGYGRESHPDGTLYVGNFFDDLKHGIGRIVFPGKLSYKGEFKYNRICGLGRLHFSDGRMYEGYLDENMKHTDFGCFTWSDRSKYIGEYRNDKRNGFGIMFFPEGKKYEGFWVNGMRHGLGLIYLNAKTHSRGDTPKISLNEYRMNKEIRNLFNLHDMSGDQSYRVVSQEIKSKALECFNRYQKMMVDISSQ